MSPLELTWSIAPLEIELLPGAIHLWAAPLDLPNEALRRCEAVLSAEELTRAARFRTGPLRDYYMAARGTLRMLLGRYLEADPAAFSIAYQPHGKPKLGSPWKEQGLEFNVSHSGGLAVYAFTRIGPIGVDVEVIRDMPNAEQLLERFFSAEETAQWRQAPSERRGEVFFQGWTRKEAWIKAVGSGLSFPLDEFCITMDGPARVLSIRGNTREAADWHLQGFSPCPGYLAAVAVCGKVSGVELWRIAES